LSERKPPGLGWESWIERRIREGIENGDFDDLPGQGKPLAHLDRPHDDMWWIRDKLRREELSYLPPALALHKELDETLDRIATARTEAEVRRHVAAINDRIVYVNSHTTSGPPSNVMPLRVDRVLEEWRRRGR
jgi:DnaJ-like protein